MNIETQIGTLAFLVRDDEILLGIKKRGFAQGILNGYGGKEEKDDLSVDDTMTREVFEECGVVVTDYQKVGELEFTNNASEAHKKWLVWIYLVTKWNGEPVETEEMKPEWFKFTDIPYDMMWPDDREWLPRILRGEKIKGSFVLDNNVLKDFKIEVL